MSELSLANLLVPISEENPTGEDARYFPAFDALREAHRQDSEFADAIDGEIKTADWEEVLRLGKEILSTISKDLTVAVWTAESMCNLNGLNGLTAGMKLLSGLLDRFWNGLYPEAEDGDYEGRANALAWFDRTLSALIREVPMTYGVSGHIYTYSDYLDAEKYKIPDNFDSLGYEEQEKYKALKVTAEAEGKITSEQWKMGKHTTSREFFLQLSTALTECWESYRELDRVMDDRFGRYTPGLSNLKKTLEGMREVTAKIVKEKGGGELPQTESQPAKGNENAQSVPTNSNEISSSTGFRGPVRSREDALAQLADISSFYRKSEPHSPIPYLLDRAIRWSNMSLEEWLAEALKDDNALTNVRETLGTMFQR